MDAWLVEAKRTAIGRSHEEKGIYRSSRADELMAHLLRYFHDHVISSDQISDIYLGCVGQHLEQGKNIARLAALLAGYPDTVPGVTINRLCASSLQAFNFAANAVASDHADAILAGGVEHMQHVPMAAALDYHKDLLKSYEFPFTNMGLTAEKVAKNYNISRQEQDQFALRSHELAISAQANGWFAKEIVSVPTPHGEVQLDQSPRKGSSLESLANLKTVFMEDGTVTAGNSSPLSDGASLTLVANKNTCKKLDLKPRAQICGFAVVGLDPTLMGMGPVPAIKKLLKKQSLSVTDIGVFELNEAFASQALACARELEIPEEKLNPAGGAIALGHPLGCTGTRLITTLINNMERHAVEWGVASMCIGHGQGIATLLKRI